MTTAVQSGVPVLYVLPTKDSLRELFAASENGQGRPYHPVSASYIVKTSGLRTRSTREEAAKYIAAQVLRAIHDLLDHAVGTRGTSEYWFDPTRPSSLRPWASRKARLVEPFSDVLLQARHEGGRGAITLHIVGLHTQLNSHVLWALQVAGYKPLPDGPRGSWKVEVI